MAALHYHVERALGSPPTSLRAGPPPAKSAEGSPGAPLVVTHHYLATRTALQVMADGGNAVDAAVAANAVVGVVLPNTCGPGGDLFALVHRPGEAAPAVLNASGRAGSGADPQRLRASGHREMPYRGLESVTAPGCVDGWSALLERFGSLPPARVLAPAIEVASEGFPASRELSASLVRDRPLIGGQPSAEPLYPDGRAPRPGARLSRPDLAATLRLVAEGGREAFYGGPPGQAIIAATEGRITAEDLVRPHADWVEPVGIDLFGCWAWTVPPNSQGYLALAAAWLVEQLDPPRHFADPAYAHCLVEAYRAVAGEREELVSDPDFSPVPAKELLDVDRLRLYLSTIRLDRAAERPPPSARPGGTTYLCTVDGEGMGVSLIQSNFAGIGSGLSAGDSGVFLQNRGAGFNLVPGHPNELAPGKRPFHTLSPTLWTRDGRLRLLLGSRGGHWQPQLVLQVACHLLHLGLPGPEAQELPRWVLDGDTIRVEDRTEAFLGKGLAERGHQVERIADRQGGWGPVSLISVEADGRRLGAADPRIDTTSARSR